MSPNTVIKAEGEVAAGIAPQARLRASGAGAKPLTVLQPGLLEALDQLVHPALFNTRRGKLLTPAHAVLVLALWVTITFAAAIVAVSRRDGSAPSDPRRCRHHTTNRRGDS